ncbi:DEAD/DEAH box helicase [Xanthomonas hortorum]|uniref:DEAD/DEAH box helicase family protein n=1 Tax=Xanthomonas hortorum TaxID=56454 RepID=A0AA47IBI4_9XANT|nr:type ISP restriction/modification enzyme [Xanthomonas hortorum]WAH63919.1 DEAD/DEAH box helicase family protein [Xanthomonas hortorum]
MLRIGVEAAAENALVDQQPPVTKIDLQALEDSQIDWSRFQPKQASVILKPKKTLRPHQRAALQDVRAGLQQADRGKLIMACGTGKTFTSLKIAEDIAGKGKRVLFLVPSLSLLSQSLTEWTQESVTPLHSFAVCSDSEVGKKKGRKEDDALQTFAHELRYPATTSGKTLASSMAARHDADHMTVVFSTYHSIDVIHHAQHDHGLAEFDLIVCDEAHRTTGATFESDSESAFVRVHDGQIIRAAKRLYMTATPRIYGNEAKAVAERDNIALYSMDNEDWYGKTLFTINFSEAVKRGLLVDYKVFVLAVEESHINRKLQSLLKDENNSLRVDDAAKIIGCWKALAKLGIHEDGVESPEPMKRAVAFCQVIEPGKSGKAHKVSSKEIAGMFQQVVEAYQEAGDIEDAARLTCEAEHVDGGMNASQKEAKLDWLKAEMPADTCRVLSNVRCLSEGVDVPALDAVLFLTPRNSQVDVVQSVGRVMRTALGKKRGYVVLPVVIPSGVEPHLALNDNKTYAVVWQVLQALRSHDDRFDAMVNKLDLVGPDRSKMEVIAIADSVQKKSARLVANKADKARGKHSIGEAQGHYPVEVQGELEFEVGEIERALYAKVVDKCGNRHHWEDWANDIARIAQTHIDRIKALLEDDSQLEARKAFHDFAAELRDDLNDKVSDAEIIEMLAQHLITKPVFEALFADYSFSSHNPMSRAMQNVLDVLDAQNLQKEASTLRGFYASVKLRAEGIDSAVGKQKIVVELYDKFFRNAFPKMTERLGIVYTPVEVVDFILHSVDHLLRKEFGQTLGSPGVHILDPFTGTGTFITRLLQSGLIKPEELAHKYKHEIHANELVLLAYYIAAINIEATYHGIAGGDYAPFEGICLTDTFQMYEKEDLVDQLLVDNSRRRKRQKALDIRVIVGNPPYSVGQKSENDNNDNVEYVALDERIRSTYAARSQATLSKGLYDSYIRAIRWASDRIGNAGVLGFVTNAGFLEANTADGLRKCLAEEFSDIYVFHLRGNQRTSGETSRKEGGKIFGSGSRAPIAISLLVKNPHAKQHGRIFFHDIGDYLSREDKLEKIADYVSIAGVDEWNSIAPDEHGDWLRQRDDSFEKFIALGDKKNDGLKVFDNFSQGVLTARDAWAYNASFEKLGQNMSGMIWAYNAEAARFEQAFSGQPKSIRDRAVDGFIDADATRISWTRSLKQELNKGRTFGYEEACQVISLYRPFTKQWVYFNRRFNEMIYQMPKVFPVTGEHNLTICSMGSGSKKDFTVLMTDSLPNYDALEKGQCFPQSLYEDEIAAIAASSEQRAASSEQRAASSEQRAASSEQRAASSEQRAASSEQRAASSEQRAASSEQRAASSEQRAASSEQRAASSEQRAASSEHTGWQPETGEESGYLPDAQRHQRLLGADGGCVAGQSHGGRHAMLPAISLRSGGGRSMSPSDQSELFATAKPEAEGKLVRREAITDAGLAHFQSAYPDETISKQDLFFYIYGILHSQDYRERYADNLSKELPRIPRVRKAEDFWHFSKAGRALGELHVNYETVDMYPLTLDTKGKLIDADYRVEKMKFAKIKDPDTGKSVNDRSTVIYNNKITLRDIPETAWDYVVNGKAALDWVMERQAVRVDNASGIVNDANDWAIETMHNPRYPLEMFQRVVTVSLETQKIVAGLPPLEIREDG